MTRRTRIISCGSYLPAGIMTNEDIAKVVNTSNEWIEQRTGIKSRHIAAQGETTSEMATHAARQALAKAGLTGLDIDAIFLATTTPDQTFPATAVTVQDNIGMGDHGFALDLQAVCSGFIYALATADNFVKSGQIGRALVIGAERFSSLLDWTDRTTCVLFGDGAGAVVVEVDETGTGSAKDRGILSTHLHSEGAHRSLLYVDGGPSTTQTVGHVRMNGKEVFRHAVTRMGEVVHEALAQYHLKPEDIRWLIPHQANQRIIDSTVAKLQLPPDRVVMTVSQHGNTSAASIPLALTVAIEDGRIQRDDLLLLEAMGGGFTWGAALVRW
ncbi:MAG: ketoacyl-ACP synthase III [Proteobacteria bacterium]|nr:ketoacyl-ACP synthase III [Pseudomonadota bacterium]